MTMRRALLILLLLLLPISALADSYSTVIQRTDSNTNYLTVAGKSFRSVDSAVVGALGVKEWLIQTPNSAVRVYLRSNSIIGDDDGNYLFTEAPTVGAGGPGTAVAALNLDRNSATVATATITEDPNITADGTTIYGSPYGWWSLFGGTARLIILKANTKYLMRWTDTGTGSTAICIIDWDEV